MFLVSWIFRTGAPLFRKVCLFSILILALVPVLVSRPAKADIGAYILLDQKTGTVLEHQNATRKWYPASLTKMMTAYLTFKALRTGQISLNSSVVQSENSISEPPSKMGFKVGTRFTVDTALKILLVKSANDVAVALAEAVGGSEDAFIALMNREAARLGMYDTVFVNPHGLPDNRQISTARDLAVLARALRADFPEARKYYGFPGLHFGKKNLRSANREFLLRVRGADGLKTGYICDAGYNVAASASRNGRTVIAVILGAGSGLERTAFARELIEKGFNKRSGQYSLASLPRKGGRPPASKYCKRNRKPAPDVLLKRYDMQPRRSRVLSYAADDDSGRIIIPHTTSGNITGNDILLPNGKTDWLTLMDRIIGPRHSNYRPLTVGLGSPTDQSGSVSVGAVVSGSNFVPTPKQNPFRQRLPKNGPLDLTKHSAPGSLFRKGIGFTAPLPVPGSK